MPAIAPPIATLDDLMRVEGKAELIQGRIVHLMASGDLPAETSLLIAMALYAYTRTAGGVAYGDGAGYAISPIASGRQSFSPDASYYAGPRRQNRMRFLPGPPTLAVEIRSENDYGPAVDREYAAKRADYFAAGTLCVWDVDPLARTVAVHRPDGSTATYTESDTAEAEPACPGWRVVVSELFPPAE